MDSLKVEQVKKIVVDSIEYIKSSDVSAFLPMIEDRMEKSSTYLLMSGATVAIVKAKEVILGCAMAMRIAMAFIIMK